MRKAMVLLPVLVALAIGALPGRADEAGWYDTGVPLAQAAANHPPFCVDPLQPGVILFNQQNSGTVAYRFNAETGAHDFGGVVNARPFTACAPNGYLYAAAPAGGSAWRFSSREPTGQAIPRVPTHFAQDGSRWVYRLDPPQVTAQGKMTQPGHIWASPDGGLTWTERGQQFRGHVESLALAESDAHVLYALTVDRPNSLSKPVPFTVWYSTDAGATWGHGFVGQTDVDPQRWPIWATGLTAAPIIAVSIVPGPTTRTDEVRLTIRYRFRDMQAIENNVGYSRLSQDFGHTFPKELTCDSCGAYRDGSLAIVQAAAARLRFETYYLLAPSSHSSGISGQVYRETGEGDPQWILPDAPIYPSLATHFDVLRPAPAHVFVSDDDPDHASSYSPDSGQTWQQISDHGVLAGLTPYLPAALLRIVDGRLEARALPDAGKGLVAPVLGKRLAPTGADFPTTGHYVPAVLLAYWQAHGGLAQFGYPRTEAFREVNAADGHAYLTQYFERARFEYHPEYAGTPNAVLLGLLGVEQTATRRNAGAAAFARLADPAQAGVTYCAPTGHTLRGPFLAYWQAHGGLALYGYPISEEFEETSPADGKTYRVQYFERNRFEYHPENRPPYDVLLGLLGNALLEQKGWH